MLLHVYKFLYCALSFSSCCTFVLLLLLLFPLPLFAFHLFPSLFHFQPPSNSNGVWRSWNFENLPWQMKPPWKWGILGLFREGIINFYDYIAFFKMVWGFKTKFFTFSEWLEGENHRKHQFKINYSNIYIYSFSWLKGQNTSTSTLKSFSYCENAPECLIFNFSHYFIFKFSHT